MLPVTRRSPWCTGWSPRRTGRSRGRGRVHLTRDADRLSREAESVLRTVSLR